MDNRRDRVIVQIPFAGLYNSIWDQELDSCLERDADYYANERQAEDNVPEEIRLDQAEITDIMHDCADWSKAHAKVAECYVSAFSDVFWEKVHPVRFEFESMSSPKYYNFSTDRVFAWVDLEEMVDMFERTDKAALTAEAKEMFTSRSGFISSYDNDWETWGDVADWDHNQYLCLIRAAIRACGDEANDWDCQLFDYLYEDISNAFQDCVDWSKFEERCEEKREEKLSELREEDPDYVPVPVRCAHTVEMFPETVRKGY